MRPPLVLKMTAAEGEYLLRLLRREIENGVTDPDALALAKKMARVWLERESENTLRAMATRRERALQESGFGRMNGGSGGRKETRRGRRLRARANDQ